MKQILEYNFIHFIGIGGVSMSALAQYCLKNGCTVSGSDLIESEVLGNLRKLGAVIEIGHSVSNVRNCDLCVYTSAISSDNVELMYCEGKGIDSCKREEFLASIINNCKYSVGISGSHGKTTTTAMVYSALQSCNVSPTLFVGGDIKGVGNFAVGDGVNCVYEACEYKRSFLKFNPFVGVILNIDCDHMDYYRGIEDIVEAFNEYADNINDNGVLIVNEQANSLITRNIRRKVYGLFDSCDVYATNIEINDGKYSFDVIDDGINIGRIYLSVLGKHNILNALAAYCATSYLTNDREGILRGLGLFASVARRFEKVRCDFTNVISDYAHHPKEIEALLSSVHNLSYNKIIIAFQPHTYSRTKAFINEFAQVLSVADKVVVLPVYPAREQPSDGVQSDEIVTLINSQYVGKAIYLQTFDEVVSFAKEKCRYSDILLLVGAGDIVDIVKMIQ